MRKASRWPWYLAGGLGLMLSISGAIAAVYVIVQGAGLFALLPVAVSIAGVLVYQGAYALMTRDEDS